MACKLRYMDTVGLLRRMETDDALVYLMAAAPDMLAALRDAEFLLRKAGINPGEATRMADSFKRCAQDAREAIAKAEGARD